MVGRHWRTMEALGALAGMAALLAGGQAAAAARMLLRPQQVQPARVERVPLARLKGVVVPQGLRRMTPAQRPKLEVWNGQGGEFNFYGPDAFIDWDRSSLKWWFRWSDAGPGAKAVWQVCRFEPPATTTNWKEPPGLAASGELSELPAAGRVVEFPIDFAAFAPKPPGKGPEKMAPLQRGGMTLAPRLTLRGAGGAPAPMLHLTPRAASPAPGQSGRSVPASTRGLSVATVEMAHAAYLGLRLAGNPWTYYVRVVVLNVRGEPTGAISTTATVTYGQPPPSDLKLPPPGPPPQPPPDPNRPAVTILEYEPIRPQAADAAEWFVVTRDFVAWKKGQVLHLTPHDPDLLDKVGDAIGGVVGFFEDAVNWVATAYQDIKNKAVDVVASNIPGCGGPCRDVLSYGLDTGLAACGLPPDLPNFDELVQMGKGNLAATLISEAGLSDVPFSEELAEKMMDKVTEQATSAADTGPGGTQWLRPLPDKQYRPAFVRVRIANPANAGTRDAGLDFLAWELYAQRYVPVPGLRPGESREVVVFLKPDYSYWERTYLHDHGGMAGSETDMDAGWTDLYYEGQADMLASVTSWPQGQVNVLSGRPVIAGAQNSDYIKQRPAEAYHAQ
jgi:hypothetical protein